ncbi:hypothetical protein AVEN_271213-1, partial [Araneus ventricosus]
MDALRLPHAWSAHKEVRLVIGDGTVNKAHIIYSLTREPGTCLLLRQLPIFILEIATWQ